jgi:hypothetical protein
MGPWWSMSLSLTTIQLEKRPRDVLKSVNKKGETFDEVITRLLKEYEQRGHDFDNQERSQAT